MAQKDYYKTLEVPRTATEQEVKSSYRRLARKYHPDVNKDNPQAADHFKEINEAYEVLGDPEKRRKYDQWGVDWEKYERAGFTPNSNSGGTTSSNSTGYGYNKPPMGGYGDIFDSIFGTKNAGTGNKSAQTQPRSNSSFRVNQTPHTANSNPNSGAEADNFGFGRGAATRPQRGEDLEQPIEITLEEALSGATRQIQVPTAEVCTNCSGTGLRAGTRCPNCAGQGLIQKSKRLEVRIPAGVDEGTKVKVSGEGRAGISGGAKGDLLLVIKLLPHPAFTRKGTDLHAIANVPLYTAVLGGEIIVTSPKGSKFALSVPSETQNGKIFRLTGQGMPLLNGAPNARGDLYVRVEVVVPSNLSSEEKRLFQQLKDLRSEQ